MSQALSARQRQAVAALQACAQRLGRPPSQRQWEQDPQVPMSARAVARLWPDGWNGALRAAGLRVGWDNDRLLDGLRRLGIQLGRLPTARDINRSAELPSAALYLRRFGSLPAARRQAGLQGLDRSSEAAMIQAGLQLAVQLGALPSWKDWTQACRDNPQIPSQWQVYRRFGGGEGAWRMFHYCLIEEAARQGLQLRF